MQEVRKVKIADETKCVCRLTARRVFEDGSCTGNATSSGFFWRHRSVVYIVTNWHCLSGIHATTLQPLGGFSPNRMLVEGKFSELDPQDSTESFLRTFSYEVPTEDSDGRRLWIEHPNRNLVDVAALRLPIEEDSGNKFNCINEINYQSRWQPEVGSDTFIIGFPEGISSTNATPIWKRASIASEPDLPYEGSPVFLVDTIGNKGLSGSPVVATGSGIFMPDLKFNENSVIGSWKTFVGVYAGRLGEEGIHSQLGRIWRAEVLNELFSRVEA